MNDTTLQLQSIYKETVVKFLNEIDSFPSDYSLQDLVDTRTICFGYIQKLLQVHKQKLAVLLDTDDSLTKDQQNCPPNVDDAYRSDVLNSVSLPTSIPNTPRNLFHPLTKPSSTSWHKFLTKKLSRLQSSSKAPQNKYKKMSPKIISKPLGINFMTLEIGSDITTYLPTLWLFLTLSYGRFFPSTRHPFKHDQPCTLPLSTETEVRKLQEIIKQLTILYAKITCLNDVHAFENVQLRERSLPDNPSTMEVPMPSTPTKQFQKLPSINNYSPVSSGSETNPPNSLFMDLESSRSNESWFHSDSDSEFEAPSVTITDTIRVKLVAVNPHAMESLHSLNYIKRPRQISNPGPQSGIERNSLNGEEFGVKAEECPNLNLEETSHRSLLKAKEPTLMEDDSLSKDEEQVFLSASSVTGHYSLETAEQLEISANEEVTLNLEEHPEIQVSEDICERKTKAVLQDGENSEFTAFDVGMSSDNESVVSWKSTCDGYTSDKLGKQTASIINVSNASEQQKTQEQKFLSAQNYLSFSERQLLRKSK